MAKQVSTDVAIIGAGTAGLYALREVKRAKKSFLMIDQGPLGTTCARVGCMPSKVALQAGAHWHNRLQFEQFGISGAEQLTINPSKAWQEVRRQRDGFAGGAAKGAKRSAGDNLIMGAATFNSPNQLTVTQDGDNIIVNAERIILAVGSRPVVPDFLAHAKEHIVTTDSLFELEALPQRMGVLGLGAIGLEMGVALSRLGIEVISADLAPAVGGIQDPELSKIAIDYFSQQFAMHLEQSAEISNHDGSLTMKIGDEAHAIDKLLVSMGRRSNLDRLQLSAADIELDDKGLPEFDQHTMRIGNSNIYVAGDVNGDRTLMHEAAAEGAIAGYNAAHDEDVAFKRKTSIGIAFTDPDIITVGKGYNAIKDQNILIGTAKESASGRSKVLGYEDGMLRIYADAENGKILGAAMIGARAEHLAQQLAQAIDRGEDVHRMLELPYYHPTVEEMLATALQDIARKIPQDTGYPLGLTPLA